MNQYRPETFKDAQTVHEEKDARGPICIFYGGKVLSITPKATLRALSPSLGPLTPREIKKAYAAAAKTRQEREVAAREAAMLEQLALERMPRSRIAEITRQRAKIAPVRAKATDLFAAFDAAAASDEREQNSLENILKAKKQEFGRQVRMPLKSPREDYKDFLADPPVWWINGLPVPKKPTAPKATKIGSGDAGAHRLPTEKRTEKDRAFGTDKTVRERIKEIVAFDDIFDRERKGFFEHNDNATTRIAAITKANCNPDAQAWWTSDLPVADRGLFGEALNNRLKATFSADYNAFLNFRRHELISCERRVGRLSPSQPAVWSQPPKEVASPRKMVTTFLDWREALGRPVVSSHILVGEYLVWRERYLFWREGRPTRSTLIVCPSLT
jgi:hypothetical protein